MEEFQQTTTRKDKKQKVWVPKGTVQKPTNGDVEMQEAHEGAGDKRQKRGGKHHPRPDKSASQASQVSANQQMEEEKKGGERASKPRTTSNVGHHNSHRPSKEEGFTGPKETWFDGKY